MPQKACFLRIHENLGRLHRLHHRPHHACLHRLVFAPATGEYLSALMPVSMTSLFRLGFRDELVKDAEHDGCPPSSQKVAEDIDTEDDWLRAEMMHKALEPYLK